jgi:preprotein translocase subunit SecG
MLYTIFLVLLFLDAFLLVVAILLQAGKGGGMAATFGGVSSSADAILGTRAAGNLLTKASWWCGGLFLGLAFLLSMMSTGTRRPSSVLDDAFSPVPTAPAGQRPVAPALPLEEATPGADTKAPAGTKAPSTAPGGTKAPAATKTQAAPSTKAPAQPTTKQP